MNAMSDAAQLLLLVGGSALVVAGALWAGTRLGLERVAVALPRIAAWLLQVCTAALSIGAVCVLLGVVPGAALVQSWAGGAASAMVLGALLTAGMACLRPLRGAPATADLSQQAGAAARRAA